MTFLIYRCRASDTLKQVDELREAHEMLALKRDDIRCPTVRIVARVGRSRARAEQDVPLMSSFIFVRWDDESLYRAQYVEYKFPFLKIMRLPQGGYATCSEKEIALISEPVAVVIPLVPVQLFKFGDLVRITTSFLTGVTGTVIRTKLNGEVTLKVKENMGWRFSTLLIHSSALAYQRA